MTKAEKLKRIGVVAERRTRTRRTSVTVDTLDETLKVANRSLDQTVVTFNKARSGGVLLASSVVFIVIIVVALQFVVVLGGFESPGAKAARQQKLDEAVIVRTPPRTSPPPCPAPLHRVPLRQPVRWRCWQNGTLASLAGADLTTSHGTYEGQFMRGKDGSSKFSVKYEAKKRAEGLGKQADEKGGGPRPCLGAALRHAGHTDASAAMSREQGINACAPWAEPASSAPSWPAEP